MSSIPYTVHNTPLKGFLSNAIGCLTSTIFASTYLVTLPYTLYSLYTLSLYRPSTTSLSTLLPTLPFLISTLLPASHSPWITKNLLGPMCGYFNYSEIRETSDEEMSEIFESGRSVILAAQPHGVISFCGMCSANYCIDEFRQIKTAAASVVTKVPILKHVMGIFGLIDASSKNLKRYLARGGAKGSVVIYIGGIAELFKSSRKEERLYLSKRKGFIKLALTTNSEILPLYLLGNTSTLTVVKGGPLASLSRKMGVSITYFWGAYNTPVPRPDQLVYVRGRPLGMPHIKEPTQEDIDKWHGIYCKEVERLFETYKKSCAGYENKKFYID